MKAKRASEAICLEQIPNIGKSLANDLRCIGINYPKQLKKKNGISLYHKLNKTTGTKHDPCVADAFLAAVDFMNGGKSKPWWKFTSQRKLLLKQHGPILCTEN